jgi:hypothetical protein
MRVRLRKRGSCGLIRDKFTAKKEKVRYMGGIRPIGSGLRDCRRIEWASWIGFFTPVYGSSERWQAYGAALPMYPPETAPALPKSPVRPSMMAASHSTLPSSVRLEPWPLSGCINVAQDTTTGHRVPAFRQGSSSKTDTASSTAPVATCPRRSASRDSLHALQYRHGSNEDGA